ncbi:MAG: DNA repair protein RecN [Desulfobacteraceae bacterium]|nr:DNA repair protein RecN [Desulfobacteraceae bacterium]MCB9494189.1 DNA repair protein RecN [Desulfobacteraceae bacterium]
MISEISIKNLAVIDDIRIKFENGLNILTGETGAGKSIIINAINLILGDRANAKAIRTGEESAEVEAFFSIEENSPAWIKMKENDFNPEEGLIIRRIIARNNRHKIYINQRLATAQILNEITKNLASVSGQHEHQVLLDEKNNIYFLDNFADLNSQREQIEIIFHEIKELREKLKSLKSQKTAMEKELELISFQKMEIENASLEDPEEDTKLEEELKKLKNARFLIETSLKASSVLYLENGSVSDTVSSIRKELELASAIDHEFKKYLTQIQSIYAEVEDLGKSLEYYAQGIDTDEEKLAAVTERLDLITKLKHKYGRTIDEINSFYHEISLKSSSYENTESQILEYENELEKKEKLFFESAQKLSLKRQSSAKKLENEITLSIRELEMPHANFFAELSSGFEFKNETGIDFLKLLISPNPGEDPKPISETASGGELSRLVLAIKSATAQNDNVSTIIFDEADAGIGGKAADKTGEKIKKLSKSAQVICITHLPQIAKFGDHHFYIEKNFFDKRTKTSITKLSPTDRITEIARMISGEKISDKALENAKEMIEQGAL